MGIKRSGLLLAMDVWTSSSISTLLSIKATFSGTTDRPSQKTSCVCTDVPATFRIFTSNIIRGPHRCHTLQGNIFLSLCALRIDAGSFLSYVIMGLGQDKKRQLRLFMQPSSGLTSASASTIECVVRCLLYLQYNLLSMKPTVGRDKDSRIRRYIFQRIIFAANYRTRKSVRIDYFYQLWGSLSPQSIIIVKRLKKMEIAYLK